MDVVRLGETDAERRDGTMFETRVHVEPGFEDPFDGHRRLSTNEVFFGPGERTAVHEHTSRQPLSVTGGEGPIVSAVSIVVKDDHDGTIAVERPERRRSE